MSLGLIKYKIFVCYRSKRKMDYDDSRWTKRRRVKTKVEEHLQFLEGCRNDEDMPSNLYFIASDEELESHASNDSNDSQICGHHDELGSQCDEKSRSEIVYSHSCEATNDQTDSDSTVDRSDPCSFSDIKRKLGNWAANHNIPHSALSELLHLLVQCGLELPKDPRTLLSTSITNRIKDIGNGCYCHIGVSNVIISALSQDSHPSVDTITLRINIDGIPLSGSSKHELWPILAKIKELPRANVGVIGLFAGPTKPQSVHEYLTDFIQELKLLTHEGLEYNGRHYSVALPDAFICDAPARAYLKCIKGHTGYSSCERCTEYGVHLGTVVFPDLTAPLRTDLTFEQQIDSEHHHDDIVSPLQELGVGMVSSFVLDYMHLVCLGHVRRIIHLWIKGPLSCRLSASTINMISDHLESIRANLPQNFSRKPRSLREYRNWKATEYRQFLLYTGPVVLQGCLPKRLYRNFMLLSVAMRILLSPALCSEHCEYAGKLLKCYVTNFGQIYGSEQLVYNTHSLIHLADDATKFGALDNVSCFPFENHLGTLKRLVRRPQGAVQQLVRRLSEKQRSSSLENGKERANKPLQPHFSGPTLPDFPARVQYRKYRHEGNVISCRNGSNCFNVEGRVTVVRNIVELLSGGLYAVCQFYERHECFYSYPVDSTFVGIRTVKQLSHQLHSVPVTDLTERLILLPFRDGDVAFLQLHNQ